MTVQNLYTQYLDGKITKQKFLYEVRRDQNLTMISPTNSFDDVIKILKNKSIISEKASKESKQSIGKQDVEIISKTIDMVNPYEYARGMDYELDIIDVPVTSGDLHTDNVLRAQKKVLANLTKNPQYYFEKLYGKDKFDGDETVEINKKSTDAIGKGKKNIIRENYFSNYGQDKSTYEEDETEADALYQRGADHYNNGAKEMAAKFRQAAILMGKRTHQDAGEFPSYDDNEGESEFDELREGIFEPGFVSRGAILKALSDVGSESEIRQYLTSLEKTSDKFETVEDYVEDFKNYVADKGLNESYNPFPMNEDQEAVLKRYAESTGIAFENLLNMVAEAKAKKKAKKDYDGNGKIESPEEEYKGSRDKAIKQAMSENEAFEDDNEPHELHILLAQLAKSAIQLAQDLKALEMEGIDNLPQWFQAKIIIAKSYIQGAREYLDGEMGNDLDESGTYAGKQSIPDVQKDPQFSSLSSIGKADTLKKLQNGDTVTI